MRPIDADVFCEKWRKLACEDCDRRKGAKNGKKVGFIYGIGEAPCRACWIDDMLGEIEDTPTINEWISVKERLPNLDKDVLVLVGADMFVMALARKDQETADIEWVDAHGYVAEMWEVTHWMPLPEPPEEEE